jgi:hypothetical protein
MNPLDSRDDEGDTSTVASSYLVAVLTAGVGVAYQ